MKQRGQVQAGGKPRAGNTECGVLWKDSTVSVTARAHFNKWTTEDEMKAIEKYCQPVNISPPWKMDPKTINVPTESAVVQQLLHADPLLFAIALHFHRLRSPKCGQAVETWLVSASTSLWA
jgi:hypothetical protein